MFKKFFVYLLIVMITASSCNKEENPPVIVFDSEGISNVFPGDAFSVTGKISADNAVSAFWFHQKMNENGNLDEQIGGRLDLASDGSFIIPVEVTKNTIGLKIIAEDANSNRSVKIFPIILGEDALIIAFEGAGYIESIEAGEEFHVKGSVTSGTPITTLSYTVVKGDLTEPPVNLEITDQMSSTFDILLTARTGMTDIRINATNRGMLTTEKLFEIKHVSSAGPVVLFDQEKISVKPDSVFVVSGQIVSERSISSISYTVFREESSDAPKSTTQKDNKFSINITADGKITAVVVTAIDSENKEGEETIPVQVLFPERIEHAATIHYKNIILDDKISRHKSYFSFDVSPYVLDATQAFLNYEKVQLMYTNLFIAGQTYTGPALFTPNVSQGSTVKGTILTTNPNWTVASWGTFNVGRLQAIGSESAFTSATGKTFDELDNLTQEEWNSLNTYLYNNGMGGSGIVRQVTTINNGWMFRIGWGGSAPASFTRVAVGIVRSFGGTPSTREGESTDAWLEIEIKMSKNPYR
ncbi:MAG: hypothetical protein LBJ72_01500 [Dysgonamonadaceae bacterium]|jgi:hypothetical protein|nr:hypothetical protein [Dysgonamonadaceae bacterium]